MNFEDLSNAPNRWSGTAGDGARKKLLAIHDQIETIVADLHNNEVGRRIAAQHPDATPEELERYVDEAIRNGELLVPGPDDNLVPSDEVPIEPGPGKRRHLPPIG